MDLFFTIFILIIITHGGASRQDNREAKCGNEELVKASYYGVPGASSEWRSDHNAALAFKPQTTKWAWNPKRNGLPAIVWYHFNYTLSLAKISFTSRKGHTWDQTPKTFDIVGSHDCSNWNILRSVTNAEFTRGGQTKSWNIPCESQKPYECYGIKAFAPMDSGRWKVVSLTNIQMSGFIPGPGTENGSDSGMAILGSLETWKHGNIHFTPELLVKLYTHLESEWEEKKKKENKMVGQIQTKQLSHSFKFIRLIKLLERDRVLQTCKLKMSLPNGYIIQDTTELDKAGASSERDKSFSAARAFQSQEECDRYTLGTDGHYYKFHSEQLTWDAARDICDKEGAFLAMEKTDATHSYIRHSYEKSMWIGVTDGVKKGFFGFWYVDGTRVQKTYWGTGEPNNYGGNEHCVVTGLGGEWNDLKCSSFRPFLCQKPPKDYQNDFPWMSNTTLPATVWYRFNKKITLSKISFNSRCRPADPLLLTPETFDVVASDDCHNWMMLRRVEAAGFTVSGQTKSWEIPCENQGEYYCYGIQTRRVNCRESIESIESCVGTGTQGVTVRDAAVAITNIKMYSTIWTPL